MIYLDNAATSFPKPDTVIQAMAGTLAKIGANPGRSGHRMALAAGRVIYTLREKLADYLEVDDPTRIIFGYSCTDALNLAIQGICKPGMHVISTLNEHNSVLRPLHALMDAGVIELTLLAPGEDRAVSASQVKEAFKDNTGLVAINHVSNVTGAVQPVAEIAQICRSEGALLLVDAAQSAGHMDIRPQALGADLLAFPGHKGFFAPHGTGALYMREGLSLRPLRQGGTGSLSESMVQPDDLPDRYESGTSNLPGLAGWLAGLRFVIQHQQEIHETVTALCARLRSGLLELPHIQLYSPPGAGLVSFNVGDLQSGEVAEMLDQADIAIRAGLHCAPGVHTALGTLSTGAVRVSPGFFNTEREIDQMLMATEIICRRAK